MNEPVKLTSYDGDVYRVFSTAYPTQELLDDLLENPDERNALKPFYYAEAQPERMDRLERIMQRSASAIIQEEISAKFNPDNWYASRYSDGTWSVLYSAELPRTALAESLYHKRKFYREEIDKRSVQIDLREVQLQLYSEMAVDLTIDKTLDHAKLAYKDESGYPYCQDLVRRYFKAKAELLRTPSARDHGGICVPIFQRNVIRKDSDHLRYYKCVFLEDRIDIFTTQKRTWLKEVD